MTPEQFQQAKGYVEVLELPPATHTLVLNELGYLAAASADPIEKDEFEALVKNILLRHEPDEAVFGETPATTLNFDALAHFVGWVPSPAAKVEKAVTVTFPGNFPVYSLNPAAIATVEPVLSVITTPMLNSGTIVFDCGGGKSSVLSIQAAFEGMNGLSAALDSLLLPYYGFRWFDTAESSTLILYDEAGRTDPTKTPVDPQDFAQVIRGEDGVYDVTVLVDGSPKRIGGADSLGQAKFVASRFVRDNHSPIAD